jgi:LmeA-like phospholipid-binding
VVTALVAAGAAAAAVAARRRRRNAGRAPARPADGPRAGGAAPLAPAPLPETAPASFAAPPPASLARPARRGRGHLVVLLVTTFVAAAALLYGADRLARYAAETLLADELQRITGTFSEPAVDVHGASFLLQAVRGRYDRVDVSLRGLQTGALRVETLDARLSDVRLSFNDLLLQEADSLVVGSAEETALMQYDDLDRYLRFTGRPFAVAPAGGDEVTITGEVQVLGTTYRPSVDARLGAEGGDLTVSPTRIDTGTDLDRAAELLLDQRFSFVVPLDPLPFGQRVVGISAAPEGLVVRAEGEDVVLPTG